MIMLEISDMDAMGKAGESLASTGSESGHDAGTILRKIDHAGAPWGGDAPGQAFWAAYNGAALTTAANASQIGPQVEALGANTSATLSIYRSNEAVGAALSREVAR